ncbi:MAG: TetR/AcrR family transcriptional regulator [Candidatus Binatia bacterium]
MFRVHSNRLRERQAAERRGRILDAAARLVRQHRGTDFPMVALAAAAEVSPATPYNLFGSKAGVLYALLNRSLDELTSEVLTFSTEDPIDRVLEAAAVAADLFARDPGFFRPLFQFLLGVRDVVDRPRFMERSLEYWKHALGAADERGLLPEEVDRDELARELLIHFAGVVELWVHEEVDDAGFRAQIVYGTALLLANVGDRAARARLRKTLRSLKRELPRPFSFAAKRAAGPAKGSAA